jgi:hypothetical protein
MDRQKVLTRKAPPSPVVWFLIDQQVLRRPVGDPEAMHAALGNVLVMAELPNITIQVVPLSTGVHPGLLGACYIAERNDGSTTLFLEDMSDGRITEDPATVREVRLRWRYACSLALPADASIDLIRREQEQWKPSS